MKYLISSILITIVLLPGIAQENVGDSREATFANLLPKETLVVLSFPDIAKAMGELRETHLHDLLMEPEIQRVLDVAIRHYGLKKRIAEFSANIEVATGLSLWQALAIFEGELSIALVDIPSGAEPIQIAGILEFGDYDRQALHLLKIVVAKLPVEKGSYDIGQQQAFYLKGLETALHYVVLPDRFLFATSENLLKQMLANRQQSASSLASAPKFRQYQALTGSGAILGYLDLEKFYSRMSEVVPSWQRAWWETVGVMDWRSWGVSSRMEGKRFVSRLHLAVEGERGINKIFSFGALDRQLNASIPNDTAGVVAARIDLAALWHEYLRCYQQLDEKEFALFYDDLQKFERAFLQFSIAKLLSTIGPNHALFHLPDPAGGLVPRWVATTEVKDEGLLLKALETFADLAHYRLATKPYKKHTIYYLANSEEPFSSRRHLFALSSSEREYLRLLLGTVAFVFVDGRLYLARLPHDLMDWIDFRDSDSATWQMPQIAQYNMFAYIDGKRFLPPLYNTFLPFAPMMEEEPLLRSLPLKAADLPRAKTIIRHLEPTIATVEKHQQDVVFSLQTSFAPEVPVIAGAAAFYLGEVWGPVLQRFIGELERYLKVFRENRELASQERFFEVAQRWQNLARDTYFESFRQMSMADADTFAKEHQQQIAKLQQELKKHFAASRHLSAWQIHGDWKFVEGTFGARNSSTDSFSLIAGETPLSDYVVQFEAKIEGAMEVLFHWNKPFDGAPQYRAIPFYQHKDHLPRWMPYKFKIHKGRVSYWIGMRHIVVDTPYQGGLVGLQLPTGSTVEIRNIQLTVEKEMAAELPKYPVIYIDCLDTIDPVLLQDTTSYVITARNEGGSRAADVVITAVLPANAKFRAASGTNYRLDDERTIVFGPATIDPGKTLKCQLDIQAIQAGSATVDVSLDFTGLNGKIMVSERTHIVEE